MLTLTLAQLHGIGRVTHNQFAPTLTIEPVGRKGTVRVRVLDHDGSVVREKLVTYRGERI